MNGTSFIALIIVLVVLGFASWAVGTAPVLDATFKAIIKWLILVLGGLAILLFVLALFGVGPGLTIHW